MISFIIPCYRSLRTLPAVVEELRTVMAAHGRDEYQVILVNDGSPDALWPLIKKLATADRRLIGLDLARNFGQAKARLAALPYIKGDIAVYLDDDGQHPLDRVIELADKVEQGYDLVFAHFPHKRHHLLRRLASAINRWLLELSGAKQRGVYLSGFFAISRLAIDHLQDYRSPFPSFTSYIMQCSDKVTNVVMPHRPRATGKSGYSFGKLFAQWLTGVTNFSVIPLRVVSALGGLITTAGLIYTLVTALRKLLFGYAPLVAVMLILGGLILLAIGLLGEYIGRIYMTVSDMPNYVIRETTF